MKVLMLGWEFPPFISGGLGTACYGLTKALDQLGIEVTFVLPRAPESAAATHVTIRSPDQFAPEEIAQALIDSGVATPETFPAQLAEFRHTRFHAVDAVLQPYARPDEPWPASRLETARRPLSAERGAAAAKTPYVAPAATHTTRPAAPQPQPPSAPGPGSHYSGDLFAEADRYAAAAVAIARSDAFDVIHAHDWMTFPAGIAARRAARKPLVVHVHSTEFDRSGEHVNQRIYDIERAGMHAADRVIAVSHLTRRIILSRYGVPSRKIEVVYNAIDDNGPPANAPKLAPIEKDEKIVLFLGRITMQKGPEYFLAAAKKVLEIMDNVRFIMAGSGDMARRMIELAAEMGIGHKVVFPGFLRGPDVDRVFQMADLYVMPSVSEPFGIAPLEALSHDCPVLISKQSGVAEILTHALKVDFWDIDEMANKIVAVLRHPPLQNTLRKHGSIEVDRLSWLDAARKVVEVYRKVRGAPVA